MTCIVGLVDDGRVWMGADSRSTSASDWCLTTQSPKIIEKDGALFGCAGSPRIGQLIRYSTTLPKRLPDDLDREVFEIVAAIQRGLREGNCIAVDGGAETYDGTILLGYRGNLFLVSNDYSITQPRENYQAIGSGSPTALGALYATKGQEPETRIRIALEAAAQTSPYVSGPFVIMSG